MNTPPKILIIDDELVLLRAMTRSLEMAGYRVIQAATGNDGLRLAQEHPPDLSLIDVYLPDMSGIEVCQRLKAGAGKEHRYVILISGVKVSADHQIEGLDSGADEYIVRPVTNQELVARVQAILRLKQSEVALRAHQRHLEDLVAERTAELEHANARLRQEIAEHQQAERALRHNRDFAEKILAASPNLIYIFDLEQDRNIYANQQITTFLGYSPEEMRTKEPGFIAAQFHPDDAHRAAENYQRFRQARDEEVVESEYRIRRANGEWRWIWDRAVVFARAADGAPIQMLGVVQDITERKRAEASHRQQHAMLQAILDYSPAYIFIKDTEGRLLLVNRLFEEFLGLPRDEIVGKTDADLFPPDAAAIYLDEDRQIMATGEAIRVEETLTINQEQRHFLSTKYPIKDDAGAVYAIGGIVTDITERKQAEQALRESEAKYRSVVTRAAEGIFILQGEHFVYANPAVKRLSGYTDEDMASLRFQDVVYEEDRALVIANNQRRLQGETFPGYVFRIYTKDHHMRWVSINATKILWEGQPAILGLVTDVTDQQQAADALRRAKEAAEAANRAKSEFIANISHEIRTPLNGILGYAQILKRDQALSGPQRDGVEIITRSANHLLQLINDILDLSRIEAGQVKQVMTSFDLPALVHELVEMFSIQARQKGVTLNCDLDPQLPVVVHGDAQRLRQILLNLVGNAVKFTDQGSVKVRVFELHELDELDESPTPQLLNSPTHQLSNSPTHRIRFEVADTGIGIPPEQLERIFQPFEQSREQTVKADGTGLGLSISQRLVRVMGSELSVSSTPGQGSTFWFDLRLTALSESGDSVTLSQPPIIGYSGPRRTILLVDDQRDNLALLGELLTSLGFEVLQALNGREALEQARRERPDAILMDLIMPEMDGYEAIRRIRQMPDLQDVIILAISADVSEQALHKSFEVGCTDFLPKPISFQELADRLHYYLDIEWRYTEDRPPEVGPTSEAAQPWTAPPQAARRALFHAAQAGRILEVQSQLDQLEQSAPAARAFVEHLRQMANDFALEEMSALLQSHLREDDHDA